MDTPSQNYAWSSIQLRLCARQLQKILFTWTTMK